MTLQPTLADTTNRFDGPTFLYVEDDSATAATFRMIFQQMNRTLNIITAPNGDVALSILLGLEPYSNVSRPSMIVLDLNLPGMDGLGLMRKIGTIKDLAGMPIVVFSSSESAEDRAQASELGALEFVHKPVDLAGFRKAVARIYFLLLSQEC